jgi:ubiquinol-cytochrome c reductase cytochrome c1 subunit
MKKLLVALLLAPGLALASSGGLKLDRAPVDTNNIPSLQRGAQVFVNYCLNCHSAAYMRYNRLQDLSLSEQQIRDNLMFAADKVGETMNVAMRTKDAAQWFGAPPPDLTVIARSRGADWLYTYLRTFYPDNSRPTGWNNAAFPSVGMPHVLYGVQGTRPLTVVEVSEVRDDKTGALTGFQRLTSTYDLRGERVNKLEKLAGSNHHSSITYSWGEPVGGQMSTQQYDGLIADLVNYLVYMGEPSGNSRVKIGIYTMLFLFLLIAVTWSLKRIYWKDVH